MRRELIKGEFFTYLAYTPDEHKDGMQYPILLFLHGAGARGTDISLLESNTITHYFCEHELPFVLVEPLCSEDTWFEVFEKLIEFASSLRQLPSVDSNRFFLTGNSMGGYAAWMLAMARPDWFSALVPVCGGGMAWNAERLKNIPIWAFHGVLDETVAVEESIRMVRAVNSAGGDAKLTLYPSVGHNSWENAYSNSELYTWLLEQR